MNDTTKKVILIVVVVACAAIAIFEGFTMTKEPPIEKAYEMGHGTPGKGMKAAELAEEKKASENAGAASSGDPLAGPTGSAAGGTPGVSGKDR